MENYNAYSCVEKNAGNQETWEPTRTYIMQGLSAFFLYLQGRNSTQETPYATPYRLGMSSHPFQMNKLH